MSDVSAVLPAVGGYDFVQDSEPNPPGGLETGNTWFDTGIGLGKVWNGSQWVEESAPGAGTLLSLSGGSYHVDSPIGNSDLANSSVTVAGQKVALGGSTAVALSDLSDTTDSIQIPSYPSKSDVPNLSEGEVVYVASEGDLFVEDGT